jgi:hypothetical protein
MKSQTLRELLKIATERIEELRNQTSVESLAELNEWMIIRDRIKLEIIKYEGLGQ